MKFEMESELITFKLNGQLYQKSAHNKIYSLLFFFLSELCLRYTIQ